MCWKCWNPNGKYADRKLLLYSGLAPPPKMQRWHKGYCKFCNKCLDSCISHDNYMKYGRYYMVCLDCKIDITNQVIAIIKEKQKNYIYKLNVFYEYLLTNKMINEDKQLPKYVLKIIKSYHMQ